MTILHFIVKLVKKWPFLIFQLSFLIFKKCKNKIIIYIPETLLKIFTTSLYLFNISSISCSL
jgi:hypothetical protein